MGNELLKPNPIEIKAAAPGDEHYLGLLYSQEIIYGKEPLDSNKLDKIVQDSQSEFAKIATGERAIWFAFEFDLPIGLIQLRSHSCQVGFENDPLTAEISDFKVVTKLQGRGIGSKLYSVAEEHARAKGFEQLVLEVSIDSPYAIEIYEHFGYKMCRENVNEETVSFTMVKNLSPLNQESNE